MSTSVTLPALGESVTEGTVTRWLKQVGDTVAADEALLEVSTDKVDTEIPSPVAGVLLEIKAEEDETVEVGAILAVIGEEGEASGDGSGEDTAGSAPSEAAPEQANSEPASTEQTGTPGSGGSEQTSAPRAEPEPEDGQPIEETTAPTADDTQGASNGGGTEVTLPALGESVTEGTVSRWLKKVGDTVEADEALLEVSTDKVDTEIPSPVSGTVLEIRVQEDETVEVGAVLAVVGEASDSSGGGAPDAGAPAQETAAQETAAQETAQVDSADTISEQTAAGDEGGQAPIPTPVPDPKTGPDPESGSEKPTTPEILPPSYSAADRDRLPEATAPAKDDPQPEKHGPASSAAPAATPVASDSDGSYVTPLVRKLANEHGVDLASLTGTGVGGRIRKQDVLAAAEAAKEAAKAAPVEEAAPAPAAAAASVAAPAAQSSSLRGTTEKMSRLRKTIAKRMVESLQVSAQLTTVVEVDLTNISRLRARVKDDFAAREGVKLSYLPFLLKATVDALKIHPKVNATIDTEAGEIHYPASENIAIAVDTEKGLLVPVIKEAGDLSIAGLARKVADLASRTRSNKLSPDDLAGGTFTVTNTGSRGALFDTPIINQPQVAILGTGALVKRPVVLTDKVIGETIAIRDMMYLALSYDHRLVDGADAARFLTTLKDRLETGDFSAEFGA